MQTILIINTVALFVLLAIVTAIVIYHFKEVKELKEENAKLRQSRDFHIKQLENLNGVQLEDFVNHKYK